METYVAVKIVESAAHWIEFHNKGEEFEVKKVFDRTGGRNLERLVLTERFKEFPASLWQPVLISKSEFVSEIYSKTRKFTNEVVSINRKLAYSKRIQGLIRLNEEILAVYALDRSK